MFFSSINFQNKHVLINLDNIAVIAESPKGNAIVVFPDDSEPPVLDNFKTIEQRLKKYEKCI